MNFKKACNLLFLFLLMSCGGGINVADYLTPTPGGDVAIPFKITQKNWTTCKKHYFKDPETDDYLFDEEGNAIWQIICINLYDEKKYAIPAYKWEEEISAHFLWVSIEQLKSWVADKEFLMEKTRLYEDNVPEALETLEEFLIYE